MIGRLRRRRENIRQIKAMLERGTDPRALREGGVPDGLIRAAQKQAR